MLEPNEYGEPVDAAPYQFSLAGDAAGARGLRPRRQATGQDPNPFGEPASNWCVLRRVLTAACDPYELLAYLSTQFAQTSRPCDHTLARITTYFDADPQQALRVFQLLDELDVRCDCEAFFMLRMITR
jgi:hypothetical protein